LGLRGDVKCNVNLPLKTREAFAVLLHKTKNRPSLHPKCTRDGIVSARIDASLDEAIHQGSVAGFEDVAKVHGQWIGPEPQKEFNQVVILCVDRTRQALMVVTIGVVAVDEQKGSQAVEALPDSNL
jgi:hypothetical protein